MGWTEEEFLSQRVEFIRGMFTFIMEIKEVQNGK
jgi:hypothetical protein